MTTSNDDSNRRHDDDAVDKESSKLIHRPPQSIFGVPNNDNSHPRPHDDLGHRNQQQQAQHQLPPPLSPPPSRPIAGSNNEERHAAKRQHGEKDMCNDDDDPHNIYERFVVNQQMMFPQALSEIRQGQKRSCWFWFVLPCAPYVVNGSERGSSMNRHFALRGDEAVKAYLAYKDEETKFSLRQNYILIVSAISQQLKYGNSLLNMLGPLDKDKAISSFKLFGRIAKQINDQELEQVCDRALELSSKTNKKKRGGRPILMGII